MTLKYRQLLFFSLAFAIASIVIFVLTPQLLIFIGRSIGMSLSSERLEQWTSEILLPTLWFVYVLGIGFLLFWFSKAMFTGGFTRARDVLGTEGIWWLSAIILWVLPILSLFPLGHFQGWFEDSRHFTPFYVLVVFILVDVLFIYWLPTAIATPRSMRYVPPGSMLLRKIYGG